MGIRLAVAVLVPLAILGLLGVLAALVTPACGLNGWVEFCPDPAPSGPRAAVAAEAARRADLEREIAALERRLATLPACPVPVPVETPPQTPAETPPQRAETPPEPDIDPDRWRARDLGVMEGCWQLDSDYSITNLESGDVLSVNDWQVCLDAAGAGRQTMRFDESITCEGPVQASFNAEGRLVIADQGNLPCSNRFQIFERVTTCSLDPSGGADCVSTQVETDSRAPVRLRR